MPRNDDSSGHTIHLAARWTAEILRRGGEKSDGSQVISLDLPHNLADSMPPAEVPAVVYRRQFNWVAPRERGSVVELLISASPGARVRVNGRDLGQIREGLQPFCARIDQLLEARNELELRFPAQDAPVSVQDVWLRAFANNENDTFGGRTGRC